MGEPPRRNNTFTMLQAFKQHKDQARFKADGDKYENTHTWCVMDGKVIDPSPITLGAAWAIYTLKLEVDPIYVPHDDHYQQLFTDELEVRMAMEREAHNIGLKINNHDYYKKPQFGYCYYNAHAFKQQNPTATIVFGSVGYKFLKTKGKKNRKKNQYKYWVQYGEIAGGRPAIDNDHAHAYNKMASERDRTLACMLKVADKVDNDIDDPGGNWGFIYTINETTGETTQSFCPYKT